MKHSFVFNSGILHIPSIKNVRGSLHERINVRYSIVRLRDFLRTHPKNKENAPAE